MGVLTSWMYPIRGVVFLLTTPELLQLVLRFLGELWAAATRLHQTMNVDLVGEGKRARRSVVSSSKVHSSS